MSEEDLLVSAGARVVHIGFNKTGTTSLQGALALARERLPEAGVVYPGTTRYHKMAGIFVTGVQGRRGDRAATADDWTSLVAEAEQAGGDRVIISSEWLCEANDEQARAVVSDLGPDKVHIVATMRPLTSILPSSWQQYLQNGSRDKYEDWLRAMLLEPPFASRRTPSFWRRHQHDVVLARWAAIVGPQNVTAVIVDSSDRSRLFRQFESLLGLPAEFLAPEPEDRENRSMTWPEAELLRHLNVAFHKRGWGDDLYRRAVRGGFVRRLAALRPATGSMPRIVLPDWALERATEIGASMATNIDKLGIRVIGDLGELVRPPAGGGVTNEANPRMSASFVASLLAATIDDQRAEEEKAAETQRFREAQAAARELARKQAGPFLWRPRSRRVLRAVLRRLPAGPRALARVVGRGGGSEGDSE